MFKFKGISSKEMDVYVTEIDNLIRKAPQRYEEIHIDGRDGAFFHPLGYSPIEVPLELTLMKPERVDEVLQWLNGTGWLEYNGRKTKAHIFSEVEPVRASTVRIIQVTIIRNPFWERVEDDWEEAWGANLIKNGWDDFEAYGSGKNFLTSKPDFSDWRTISGTNAEIEQNVKFDEIGVSVATRIKTKKGRAQGQLRGYFQVDMPAIVEVYIKNNSSERMFVRVGKPLQYNYVDSGETKLVRIDFDNYIESGVEFGGSDNLDIVAWNPIVYKKGDKPLTVIKTPLGNGLTRIQTWGGNHSNKLVLSGVFTEKEKQYTFSSFMSNLSETLRVNMSHYGTTIVGKDEHVTMTSEGQGNAGIRVRVRTEGVDNNLDFIASDPVIVEGNKAPNWQATSDPAIYNEGTAVSKPLIKLEKGKDRQCEFEVNGTYFKFHFNDDDHVILDCEKMEATYNGFNRNRHLTIGFEWPKLKPKENFVKRISGDAKISFKRKDRWL